MICMKFCVYFCARESRRPLLEVYLCSAMIRLLIVLAPVTECFLGLCVYHFSHIFLRVFGGGAEETI